jgi:hypothetical protein
MEPLDLAACSMLTGELEPLGLTFPSYPLPPPSASGDSAKRSLRRQRPGPRRSTMSARVGSPTLSVWRSHLSASLETAGKQSTSHGMHPR